LKEAPPGCPEKRTAQRPDVGINPRFEKSRALRRRAAPDRHRRGERDRPRLCAAHGHHPLTESCHDPLVDLENAPSATQVGVVLGGTVIRAPFPQPAPSSSDLSSATQSVVLASVVSTEDPQVVRVTVHELGLTTITR
jgi:hypothetical protein